MCVCAYVCTVHPYNTVCDLLHIVGASFLQDHLQFELLVSLNQLKTKLWLAYGGSQRLHDVIVQENGDQIGSAVRSRIAGNDCRGCE